MEKKKLPENANVRKLLWGDELFDNKDIKVERLPENARVRESSGGGGVLYPKEARGRTVKISNEVYAELYKFIGQMQMETGEHVTPNTAVHELLTRCKHEPMKR